MKVAIIQRTCPHYRRPLFNLLASQDGIELTLLVSDDSFQAETLPDPGFSVINLPAFSLRFSWGVKQYFVPFSPSIIRELLKGDYDAVITEDASNILNNLLIYPVSRLSGLRFVWWGVGRRRNAPRNIFRRMADPFISKFVTRADACIAYGTAARDYMQGIGAHPARIFVAHNTLDVSPALSGTGAHPRQVNELRRDLGLEEHKIILFVGMIEKRKKVENLILAFHKLRQNEISPTALLIVGDGPHHQTLQEWCESSGLSADVHFMGRIIEGVDRYFSMCDVFVLPSEGGLALNQAMAHGKAVIATSADGTEIDLIGNGQNGFIVEEDDIRALSQAISEIIRNPVRQEQMGRSSLEKMRKTFTLENMVKEMMKALHFCTPGKHYECTK